MVEDSSNIVSLGWGEPSNWRKGAKKCLVGFTCVHMTQLEDIDDDYEYQASTYLSSWTRVCGSLNTAIHQQVSPFIANCNKQKISTIVMTWIIVVISSYIWAELPRVFLARKFDISRLCFYLQLFSRGGDLVVTRAAGNIDFLWWNILRAFCSLQTQRNNTPRVDKRVDLMRGCKVL